MSTAIISNSITHSIALRNSKLPVLSNIVPNASLVAVGTTNSPGLQVQTVPNMTASKKQVNMVKFAKTSLQILSRFIQKLGIWRMGCALMSLVREQWRTIAVTPMLFLIMTSCNLSILTITYWIYSGMLLLAIPKG